MADRIAAIAELQVGAAFDAALVGRKLDVMDVDAAEQLARVRRHGRQQEQDGAQ